MTSIPESARELEPCPFCQSKHVTDRHVRDGRQMFCQSCGASVAPTYHGPNNDTLDRAIAAWNTRARLAPDGAPADVGEALAILARCKHQVDAVKDVYIITSTEAATIADALARLSRAAPAGDCFDARANLQRVLNECAVPSAEELELAKAAIDRSAAPAGDEVVAWLHTLHTEDDQTDNRLSFNSTHPFGLPGRDYSTEYSVTSEPLALSSSKAGIALLTKERDEWCLKSQMMADAAGSWMARTEAAQAEIAELRAKVAQIEIDRDQAMQLVPQWAAKTFAAQCDEYKARYLAAEQALEAATTTHNNDLNAVEKENASLRRDLREAMAALEAMQAKCIGCITPAEHTEALEAAAAQEALAEYHAKGGISLDALEAELAALKTENKELGQMLNAGGTMEQQLSATELALLAAEQALEAAAAENEKLTTAYAKACEAHENLQFEFMTAAAEKRVLLDAVKAARPIIVNLIEAEHNVDTWGLTQRLAAIDAALAGEPRT